VQPAGTGSSTTLQRAILAQAPIFDVAGDTVRRRIKARAPHLGMAVAAAPCRAAGVDDRAAWRRALPQIGAPAITLGESGGHLAERAYNDD